MPGDRPSHEDLLREIEALRRKMAELDLVQSNVDLADLQRAEEALARSDALHRTTIDALADAVHLVDTELRVQVVNARLREWIGLLGLETDPVGKRLDEAFPFLEEQVLAGYRRVIATGEALVTSEERDLGGHHIVTETRKVPVERGGRVAGVLTVLRDVTAERETQRQLQQVQKMDAVGRLAGGVAHDINNLLTGIIGFASLIEMESGDESPNRDSAGEILGICKRARDLTRNLLGFARKGTYRKQRLDLRRSVRDVHELLRQTISKKIRLELRLDEDLPAVEGDAGQIGQILMNLCINSAQAIGEGSGLVTIAARRVDVDAEIPGVHGDLSPGPYVRLTVRDTGSGIDPGVVDQVFEPFFTTKAQGEGTGLGLSMVYGAVQSNGGAVSLESVPGEGTAVRIWLPAVTEEPAERAAGSGKYRALTEGAGTVLLVDDEAMVRKSTGRMLTRLGYEVLVAADGVEALEVFASAKDRVSLVLLDMVMPVMDGAEAFRRLRDLDPEVRVLLFSGYSAEESAEELIAEGAVGFMRKPFMPRGFADAVADALSADRAPE